MVLLRSSALVLLLAGACPLWAAGETVLYDFSADWCGPCQQMRPVVDQLASAGHPVRVVNIDRERALAAQYRVTNIPCFVMVVDGREVDRVVGPASSTRLAQMLAMARPVSRPQSQPRMAAQSPDNGAHYQTPNNFVPPSEAQPMRQQAMPTPPGRAAAAVTQQEQALLDASVRLVIMDSAGKSYGSGTIVDTRGQDALVLTCGHIFRDSQGQGEIEVHLSTPQGKRQVPGTIIAYDLKRDLGLVSIRPGVAVQPVKVAGPGTPISLGNRVTNVGCNNGDDPSPHNSRITGLDKYLGPPNIEVAGMPVEGRSGGGLFNEEGQLIGVCFAADPKDNEGVYAGLDSIHKELERHSLMSICAKTVHDGETDQGKMDELRPPAMPSKMPSPIVLNAENGTGRDSASARSDSESQSRGLSGAERAALAEIGARGQDAEVICIIRPLSNPDAKSEIIVLDRASPQFLQQITQRSSDQRRLTSLDVPNARPQTRVTQEQLDANGWRDKQ